MSNGRPNNTSRGTVLRVLMVLVLFAVVSTAGWIFTQTGSTAPPAGQRVTLQVAARETSNKPAFVLGKGDGAMLVVAGRDTRDGVRRAHGLPAQHGIDSFDAAASTMTVTGIVMPEPGAEEMYSWRLTPSERALVHARGGYLRADRITYDKVSEPTSAGSDHAN